MLCPHLPVSLIRPSSDLSVTSDGVSLSPLLSSKSSRLPTPFRGPTNVLSSIEALDHRLPASRLCVLVEQKRVDTRIAQRQSLKLFQERRDGVLVALPHHPCRILHLRIVHHVAEFISELMGILRGRLGWGSLTECRNPPKSGTSLKSVAVTLRHSKIWSAAQRQKTTRPTVKLWEPRTVII